MSQNSQTLPTAKEPLQVGVTGGIGSGKTTVCRIFEQLGIPVYYADERAKALMVEEKRLIGKVKKLFGEEAYLPDGSLNRKWIADIVFQDAAKLEQLNAIVHPAVMNDGEKWHKRQRNLPYTIKESALLFEIGSEIFYDKTVAVYAPKEIRIQRAMQRDGLSRAAVEARMAKQMDDEKKAQIADYVIINDGEKLLMPQVLDIHRQLVEAFRNL
jgi:dephospho-CoA kinase